MKQQLKTIPIDCIQRGEWQPRKHFDQASLKELADSILQSGVIEPVVVRPLHSSNEVGAGRPGQLDSQYELLAGERRWRAAAIAQLDEIPAVVRIGLSDEDAGIISLAENLQREDLKPIEAAAGIARVIEENNLTHQEAATMLGCSRVSITNSLRLLELDPQIQLWIDSEQFSKGHAKSLLALPKEQQLQLAHTSIKGGWSVRHLEREIKKLQTNKKTTTITPKDPDTRQLEIEISEALGSTFTIERAGQGYKLVIDCYSLDEVDNVIERLRKRS